MAKLQERFFPSQGGIDFMRGKYSRFPDYWADLVNWHVTPAGLESGVGWSAMGAEITSAASGIVTHLTGMSKSDETLERLAGGTKQLLRWNGAAWTSIQDGTNFTAAITDPLDSTYWGSQGSVGLQFGCVPQSGVANALWQTTGAAALTRIAGAPRNGRFMRVFGNRLCTWGDFNGATYLSTEFQFSGLNDPTTWSAVNQVTLDETGDGAAGMESLDKSLMLFKVRSSPTRVEITDNPDSPFVYPMLPGSEGMLNAGAKVKVGQRGVAWAGTRNIHLFNDTELPADIGNAIVKAVYPQLTSTSRLLGGWDAKRSDREALYFLSNIATASDAFIGNSVAVTNQYIGYDFLTGAWFRGDLGANAPNAMGNYPVQVGDRSFASSAIYGTMMSLNSANGSTIFDCDFATTTRAGATFTRTAVWPYCDYATIKRKQIRKVQPIFDNIAGGGTVTVAQYAAEAVGQVPVLQKSLTMNLDGTTNIAPWADFTGAGQGRFIQHVFSTTAAASLLGVWVQWEEVPDGDE